MVGGQSNGRWIVPLVGVVGMLGAAAAPAGAADLGGNCCADLEERIAELEATTARKGNRKVSLTISGWVNEAVLFWDDGAESNAYVGTNSLEEDRVRFTGEAKITDGWSAGYTLEVGLWGSELKGTSQAVPNGTDSVNPTVDGLRVRKSSWFVKSKDLGRLLVGQDGSATYHLIDDVDQTLTRNVSDFEAAGTAIGAFKTREGGVIGNAWTDYMGGFNNSTPGQNGRRNIVRYDTPTFANFTVSAAWGEDDLWDVALSYKGDIGDFKVVARAGYGESTSAGASGIGGCKPLPGVSNGDCQWWGAGASILHAPTGLYVYGGYAETQLDVIGVHDGDSETYFIQTGIEKKWFSLGKTNIFGEYRHDNVGVSKKAEQSDLDFWAAGVAQNVENAETTFYAAYRQYDGDVQKALGGPWTSLDSFHVVITGAKINF